MVDDANPPVERVELIMPETAAAGWQPHVGAETMDLLQNLEDLDKAGRARVRVESAAILANCVPPNGADREETGLVVGHVQSGKTISFTTVAALAQDNQFPLVILITGTSTTLSRQSLERLKRDLRLSTRRDRCWQHFHNPSRQALHTIQGTLEDWRDPEVPESERQTVLITVMKHHGHLGHLNDLLGRLDLRGICALVVDDEADQAGLNTLVTTGGESTTYRHLLGLRRGLPHHTYLGYTATPQAPLLINLIDVLSPRFAEVLTPGPDYVGGREFFIESPHLVRTIPGSEIPTRDNPLGEPPDSLLEAMRVYLLGVAAGMALHGGSGNRSMMVHPSQQTMQHAEYVRWVRETMHNWAELLRLEDEHPDRLDLVEDFASAYEDLHRTVPDLPELHVLLTVLRRATRRIQVTEVNAVRGATPQVDWQATYGHILVGGQAMDRGFTVKGLTVTYMPRGIGIGNADTIQQRARFFGYKRQYLGYCRLYLEAAARGAYRRYVEHEEDIRERLIAHRRTGRPLTEWKRAFFLDSALQPTRRNVLDLDYMQAVFSDEWYTPRAPHDSADAVEWNRAAVSAFVGSIAFREAEGHPRRTETQKHLVADRIPLARAFAEFLTRLRITRPSDSQPYTGLLLQVAQYLEANPDATCDVYLMSPRAVRERGLNDNDEIPNLFQGAYPVEPLEARGSIYPGDRHVRNPRGLTVQIHRVEITGVEPHLPDVPVVAVWVPADMGDRSWLVQDDLE